LVHEIIRIGQHCPGLPPHFESQFQIDFAAAVTAQARAAFGCVWIENGVLRDTPILIEIKAILRGAANPLVAVNHSKVPAWQPVNGGTL
jgi:hypothetical protein